MSSEGSEHARIAQILRDFGLGEEDLAAWLASGRPEEDFDDWVTDRLARRPAGARAREVYGAEDAHDFARRAILGALLLRDALGQGARATGIDHSEEMVRLARERAAGAGVMLASAERLPFGEGAFTAVAMSIVFFFLDDGLAALRECRRVLGTGGRLALYTTAPELRGTPAAPEPVASLGHFYGDDELVELARRAELREANVLNEDGGQLLTASR